MTSHSTVRERVEAFNAGRDPARLQLKYAAMRKDAFGFLRGSCHLFYEDLKPSSLPRAPLVWCSGDLHLGNFGTYKGDNRLTYFDMNDFDEACLAPATWDLVRMLCSVIVTGHCLSMNGKTVTALMRAFLESYAAALRERKARWVERTTAQGMIRTLLLRVKKRNRKEFLNTRTTFLKGRRHLLLDGKRALALERGERAMLQEFMAKFAAKQGKPEFFRLEDAARRIAGTGSLGLDRFVLLVAGHGGVNGHFLLDLKYQPGSCVILHHHLPQPAWANEAERVAVTQHDVQAVPPALLCAVRMERKSWLMHELMPTTDRLNIDSGRDDVAGLTNAFRTLGEVVAWGNIRAEGWRGSAGAEELIEFGNRRGWAADLLEVARDRARCTLEQWREFSEQ